MNLHKVNAYFLITLSFELIILGVMLNLPYPYLLLSPIIVSFAYPTAIYFVLEWLKINDKSR